MDPNETARLLMAALERSQWEAVEAHAHDLLLWLDIYGFPPVLIGSAQLGSVWHRRIARAVGLAALTLARHELSQRDQARPEGH